MANTVNWPGSEQRTGADVFFRKPFDPTEVAECAARLLEGAG